jgi:hypothetical protein
MRIDTALIGTVLGMVSSEVEPEHAWNFVRSLVEWVISLALYALVVAVGTLIFLVGSLMVGYLPYSDRPGPGWGRGAFDWSGFSFFLSWLPLLLYFLLYIGAALFPLARLLSWFHSPRWLLRVFGGLFAGIAALVGVSAAGWYIAISAYPVYAGGMSGMIYGALILPRFAGPVRSGPAKWWQWIGTAATIVGCGAFVAYPLIPHDQPNESLEVEVVRLIAGPGDLTAQTKAGLNQRELKYLKSLGLTGTLDLESSGQYGPRAQHERVVIVLTAALRSFAEFREPSADDVIYVQQGDAWIKNPPEAPTIRKKISVYTSNGIATFEVE